MYLNCVEVRTKSTHLNFKFKVRYEHTLTFVIMEAPTRFENNNYKTQIFDFVFI